MPPTKKETAKLVREGLVKKGGGLTDAGELRLLQLETLEWMRNNPLEQRRAKREKEKMDDSIIKALKTFHTYSAGKLDVWSLAGDAKAKVDARRQIMAELTGTKVPRAKCGITAIRELFQTRLGATGDTIVAREADFIKKARAILAGGSLPEVTVKVDRRLRVNNNGSLDKRMLKSKQPAVTKQLAEKRDPDMTQKLIDMYEANNALLRQQLRGGR